MDHDITSLENMLSNISINGGKQPEDYSKNLIACVFRHIIAFSLAFTRQNTNIAFRQQEVSQIYNILSWYLANIEIEENALTIPFLPCLYNNSSVCYSITEFQNSYGFLNYIEKYNITKTYFKHASHFLLESFCSPHELDFFQNWSQEQLQILYKLVEYINKNWNDIGEDCDYDYDYDFYKFNFLLYDMQIIIE